MPDGIAEATLLDYRYQLVDMHQVNCAGLLVQDNPDALVLAVLCDFGDRAPEQMVHYIVRRLKELLRQDDKRFREYMSMLEILSENRNLQAQIKEAEKMLTQVDVKRLPSYQLGYEDGEAKNQRQVVRQLLCQLDASRVAELLGLDIAEVERIASAQDDDATRDDQQTD
ncbi:hypothetical protein CKO31_16755 [Thiohalocapsa halophila]|uniref:Rpn family recombination-promoting nuclease/putative transposase n=2 Tax=Thiohalocapsa halophila TaxID=69359 RepID=A0ABS1CK92_9GAMM|nr:hypothetical protein [Thiohalocapsa halophila]